MGNFKVKVDTPEESKEAQELFQKLVGKENGFITMDKSIRWVALYQGQVVQYEFLPSVELNEITLPELRVMVKPMKEYLDQNRNYEFVLSIKKDDGFIEIPDGAEILAETKNGLVFYKKHGDRFAYCFAGEAEWGGTFTNPYDELGAFVTGFVWQRDQDEPFLTPECKLNDQYAEIEQVRQASKDNVNNPQHYNKGGVECIDAIEASMTHEAFKGYLKGNVQKYMWRYEQKGGVESLRKAQWYLERLVASMDS